MKINEVLTRLEILMDGIEFTRVIPTQENIETPSGQYKIVSLVQNPSMSYKKWNFIVEMRFESMKQYEDLFEDSDFYGELLRCYQCSDFALDDQKLLMNFKCEVVW